MKRNGQSGRRKEKENELATFFGLCLLLLRNPKDNRRSLSFPTTRGICKVGLQSPTRRVLN